MLNKKWSGNKHACRIAFVFFILFIYFPVSLVASENGLQQPVKVGGVVVDQSNTPLIGVTVLVKGTTSGTITGTDGSFEIDVPPGSVLIISYIGYRTVEVPVTESKADLQIVLEEDVLALEEVVVVGYGVQKKETVTGSMSSVSADEIVQQPVSNVSQALAGRLPGLITNQAGGRPGRDGATIRIRGIGTLDAGSGSNPLILIDGIERDQTALNFLDPNEMESLSILKDASATAVFGVRGANGVILVTTRRGKVGPPQVNYKASMAAILPTFRIDPVDSYLQTGLANEFMGFPANTSDPSAPYPQDVRERFRAVVEGNPMDQNDPYFYPDVDYADLMLKDYATQQQHNFTVSGGTESVRYFASLGYFNQGGLFENLNPDIDQSTSYNRYNYRTNVDINLTESTLAKINIGGSFNEHVNLGMFSREPATNFYWSMLVHSSPWDGYVHEDKLVMIQENANSVLLNTDMRGYNIQQENTADYSLILDQKLDFILRGLSVKGTASLVSYFSNVISREISDQKIVSWRPYLDDQENLDFYQVKESALPANQTWQYKNRKEYFEFALNYNRSFGNHNVTGLALVNAEKSHFTETYWNEIPRSYLGIVGRITYNYANRYMLEYNAGYNGSENFAEGKRFGFFPAYSAGWSFTEEPWLKELIGEDFLSYGKLRFSYGKVGNDRIGQRFLYLPDKYVMNNSAYLGWYDYGVNFGQPGEVVTYPVAYQGSAGNPNVTWENAVKVNYGTNLSFLQNRLRLVFDYFAENRKDILINQRVVPVYQQTGELALNLGEVENKGYEIELGWRQSVRNTMYWVNLNYTVARNRILEMDEPEQPYDYRMQTGKRVGELWGYMQEGIFMTAAEADAYREQLWQRYSELNPDDSKDNYQAYQIFTAGHDVSAGDLKFIDRNNDGLINNMDEGFLDTPGFPETMFGLQTGLERGGFSVSVLLQGASDFAINTRTNYNPTPARGTILDFVMDRYTPERYDSGETIQYPRLLDTNDNWKHAGSFWIQDATYLRLKNLVLGYTFDSSRQFIQRAGIDQFMVYASGMDLFTLSRIRTIDPETTNGVLRYPRSMVINLGFNLQF